MSFVKREGGCAPYFYRYALKHGVDEVWREPPDFIRDTILLEQFALT
jgi:hypothetical protein